MVQAPVRLAAAVGHPRHPRSSRDASPFVVPKLGRYRFITEHLYPPWPVSRTTRPACRVLLTLQIGGHDKATTVVITTYDRWRDSSVLAAECYTPEPQPLIRDEAGHLQFPTSFPEVLLAALHDCRGRVDPSGILAKHRLVFTLTDDARP